MIKLNKKEKNCSWKVQKMEMSREVKCEKGLEGSSCNAIVQLDYYQYKFSILWWGGKSET